MILVIKILMDHVISARCPDIVVIDKGIIYQSTDKYISAKEYESLDKYQDFGIKVER